uniref:Xylanase inhibitor N-terminal domain-containing protein n=1 Tax=Lactuca sativa TaxID=4236 RepID=A0A9R1XW61_LACSA|nr:hypothetical protein LSAT_V11C100041370 [Lactuca sativa]
MEFRCRGFLLLSMIQQTRQHLLLSYARTKDVLLNPTHVQITNPPTISTMEMVVEHQLIIFSTFETGQISQTERTLDEIMGLGRKIISVISQISSQGIAPNSFGHCLAGGDGGGILAFGTPVMPDLVFTPLVKSILPKTKLFRGILSFVRFKSDIGLTFQTFKSNRQSWVKTYLGETDLGDDQL